MNPSHSYEECEDNMDLFRAVAVLKNLRNSKGLTASQRESIDEILHGNSSEAQRGLIDELREPLVENQEPILEHIAEKLKEAIRKAPILAFKYKKILRTIHKSVVAARVEATKLRSLSESNPRDKIAQFRLKLTDLEAKAEAMRGKINLSWPFRWTPKPELERELKTTQHAIKALTRKINDATNPNESFLQKTQIDYKADIMSPISQGLNTWLGDADGVCAGGTSVWAADFLFSKKDEKNDGKVLGIYPNKAPPLKLVKGLTARRYPDLNNLFRIKGDKVSRWQFLLSDDQDGTKFANLVSAERGQSVYVHENVCKDFVNTKELGKTLIDCVENSPDHVCFLGVHFRDVPGHLIGVAKDKDGMYHFFEINSVWARFRNSRDLEQWLPFYLNRAYADYGYEIDAYRIMGFSLTPPPPAPTSQHSQNETTEPVVKLTRGFTEGLVICVKAIIKSIINFIGFIGCCLGFMNSQQSAEQVRPNTTSDAAEVSDYEEVPVEKVQEDEDSDCEELLLRRVEKIEKTELSNWDAESPAREESPPTNKYAKEDGETSGYKGPSLRSAKRHDDDHEIFGMLDVSKTAIKDAQKRARTNLEFTTAKAAPGAASTCSSSFWKQRAPCSSSSSSADEVDVSCTSTKFVK